MLLCAFGAYNSPLYAEEFLPVEQAFHFQYMQDGSETILRFEIAPEYYLYKPRIAVTVANQPQKIDFIQTATAKHDATYGDTEVFYREVDALMQTPPVGSKVVVHYQGCAEAGLCYPPQQKDFIVQASQDLTTPMQSDIGSDLANQGAQMDALPSQNSIITTPATASSNDIPQAEDQTLLQRLQSGNLLSALALFFGLGILTAFAGCSYPMFPILSKIIMGDGAHLSKKRAFSLSLAYVLPIAVVYALIGLVAGFFGKNLATVLQTPWALSVVALILVAMALSMFGLFEINLPSALSSRLNNLSQKQKGGTYIGAVAMGTLSAFIVSACSVPPIVAALTLITQSGNLWLGTAAMFMFGLGLGSPLLLLGLSASWLLPKAGQWMQSVQRAMAVLLIAAAIYIISRFANAVVTQILWLLFALALGLGLLFFKQQRFFVLVGAVAMFAAGMLASQWQQPAHHAAVDFIRVHDNQSLQANIHNGKVSMIDFYADWCVSCKVMEKEVFTQPQIAAKLQQLNAIKLDITDIGSAQQQIMTQYQVIGAPAILFLDQNGNELRHLRVTGEMNAADFGKRLDALLKSPPL